jgi:hypothetical protein
MEHKENALDSLFAEFDNNIAITRQLLHDSENRMKTIDSEDWEIHALKAEMRDVSCICRLCLCCLHSFCALFR